MDMEGYVRQRLDSYNENDLKDLLSQRIREYKNISQDKSLLMAESVIDEVKTTLNLKDSDDDFLKEITFFTKQVAIALYGREKVASLYGQSWIDFLNKHGSVHFSKDFVELLEKNMYALQKSLTDSQKEKIFKLYEAWIKENLKRKGKE